MEGEARAEGLDGSERADARVAQLQFHGAHRRLRRRAIALAGFQDRGRTPAAIVETLNREAEKALDVSTVREKLTALGVDPMIMSPSEFDTYVRKDIVGSAALVKSAGIKPD